MTAEQTRPPAAEGAFGSAEDADASRRRPRGLGMAVASTSGARVANMVLSFGVGVLASRALGPDGRGELAVSIASASVFAAIFAVGMDTANLRFAGLSTTAFRQAVRLNLGLIAGVGLAAVTVWGLSGLAHPAVRLGLDGPSFGITLLLGPVTLMSALISAAEIGRGRPHSYNLVMNGSLIIFGVGVAVLTAAHLAEPATVIGAYAVGQIAGLAGLLVSARAGAPTAPLDETLPASAYRRYSRRAYLPNMAQFAMLRGQIPMLALLAGSETVGIYAVALPLAETILVVPLALSLILVPSIARGDADWFAVARLVRICLAISLGTALAVAVAVPFAVPAVYGEQFQPAVAAVWSLLPGTVLFAAGRTAQSYLVATDRPTPTALAAAGAAVTAAIVMVALVRSAGAVGAGAAATVGYLVYASVTCGAFYRIRPPSRPTRSASPRQASPPPALDTARDFRR